MTNKEELKGKFEKEFCFENNMGRQELSSIRIRQSTRDDYTKSDSEWLVEDLFDFFWQEIEQARRTRDEEILTGLYRIMGNTAGCGMDDIFLYAQKLGIDLTNVKHQDLTN